MHKLGPVRNTITDGCDVVLVALVYCLATDAPWPATVIATGLVLAVRTAASLPRTRRRD